MNRPLRVLALCAGYGGLEMALAAVEGEIELVAYAEYDDAPARIMAHHHPGVPNLRDVTKIDWSALSDIDVMTAGYPCQPFSGAGKRLGEADPRHLWPHIAKGIYHLRPRMCFFENVRGHLSLGLDQVLLDLDDLDYDVRVYLLRAADVGAAHGRARIFIFAEDRYAKAPSPLPFGTPVAVARDGQWFEPEEHFFGAEPFTGDLPGCSRLIRGHLYAEPRWTTRSDGFPLLQTPVAAEGSKPSNTMGVARREATGQVFLTNQIVTLCGLDPSEALLPTPQAHDAQGGKTAEQVAAMRAKGAGVRNLNEVAVNELTLLSTPQARDYKGLPSDGFNQACLVRDVQRLVEVENGDGRTDRVGDGVGVWSPTARDELDAYLVECGADCGFDIGSGTDGLTGGNDCVGVHDPTVSAGPPHVNRPAQLSLWRQYEAAIRRAEAVTGRPPPAPTETSPRGKPRLSAEFVEWLMMLPAGHVTGVPGITRNQALKALGNGVVPAQAAAALRAYIQDEKEKAA